MAVGRLVHDVPVPLELLAQQLADRLVVVDDEDVRRTVGAAGAEAVAQVAQQGAGVEPTRSPEAAALRRGSALRSGSGRVNEKVVPLADLALDVEVPAVVLDDLLADGQPEPGALRLAGQGVADLLEPHEQLAAVRRGDARPGVGDRHDDLGGVPARPRPSQRPCR